MWVNARTLIGYLFHCQIRMLRCAKMAGFKA